MYYDFSAAGFPSSEMSCASVDFHSRFRRHPGFSSDDVLQISSADFRSYFSDDNFGFFVTSGADVLALCSVLKNQWETDFFGVPMARLHCFSSSSVSDEELSLLVERSVSNAFERGGIRHVSVDVDIDDYKVLNCLSRNGFEILDLKRTYFTNRLADNPEFSRSIDRVRSYSEPDFEDVKGIISSAKFETRFTRDRFLRRECSEELYRRWFSNLVAAAGKSSDVVVFERMGRVVGCGGIGEMSFSRYGIDRKMRTGSLYACSPDGVGGYAPVLYRLTRDAISSHGLVETTVSLNNAAAVRVVEGVRPNRSTTSYAMRLFIV